MEQVDRHDRLTEAGASGEIRQPSAVTTLEASAISQAARRILGRVNRTPVVSNAALDEIAGGRVFVKVEPLQRSGSFKARGAFNRLLQLTHEQRERGVIAYSSGNHGAAIALAAADLEIPAVIVVPKSASALKLEQIRAVGGELVWYDPANADRAGIAAEIAAKRGLTLVPPYDDYAVMAGQGTVGLELIEDVGDLDLLVVPVGGGGLIAGVGTISRALCPRVRIFGVEPSAAADHARSLAAGSRVSLEGPPDTIADGLRTLTPGELTFPVNQRLLEGVITVQEAEIVEAMQFCFERLKVAVEPSGAVAIAAILSGRVQAPGERIGVVLSGGNVDTARFASLVQTSQPTRLPFVGPSRQSSRPPRDLRLADGGSGGL